MSCLQLMPKNWLQVSRAAWVESDGGTNGNPMLQVGGEQEAVTEPEPGKGVESTQDCRHPAGAPTTAGCGELPVEGGFVRRNSLFRFGEEMFSLPDVQNPSAL